MRPYRTEPQFGELPPLPPRLRSRGTLAGTLFQVVLLVVGTILTLTPLSNEVGKRLIVRAPQNPAARGEPVTLVFNAPLAEEPLPELCVFDDYTKGVKPLKAAAAEPEIPIALLDIPDEFVCEWSCYAAPSLTEAIQNSRVTCCDARCLSITPDWRTTLSVRDPVATTVSGWSAPRGDSRAVESAVLSGLNWLARHQTADGGWNFDHTNAPNCQGQCQGPGELKAARNAATALALLAFLGAGHTHKEGLYRVHVRQGMTFLIARQSAAGKDAGSFEEPEGKLLSHALATLALCELYAMTHDQALREPAQNAVRYLVSRQDPMSGGWPDSPRQAGQAAAIAWPLLALRSAQMTYLETPNEYVSSKANQFLDLAQSHDGARFGASEPGGERTATAGGLLGRALLGRKLDHPAMLRGAQQVCDWEFSATNLEFDYFATLLLRHQNGEHWQPWNTRLRESLVSWQEHEGHAAGSWNLAVDHRYAPGGELYSTALAIMMLEVYYRHLPIYGRAAVAGELGR